MKNKNLKKNVRKKSVFSLVVVFLMLNPMLIFAWFDSSKPKYISINEDQDYVWKTMFNKKPLTNMYIDLGFDEEIAEALTDAYFEYLSFSESSVQWKVESIFLSAEADRKINGIKTDYINYIYKISKYHKINDETGRKTIDKWVKIPVFEYRSELYRDMFISWMLLGEEMCPYQARAFFIANNVDWKELVDEINKEIDTDSFNIQAESVNFGEVVGLEIIYLNEDVEELKDLKLIVKYTDGIMYNLRLSYNYETIYEFELEGYPMFLMENWILISILLTFIILIAIAFILIKRRK